MIKRFLCFIWACSALLLPVLSEETVLPRKTVLTLDNALSIALKNNPNILGSEIDVERARALTQQLAAVPNPDLVFRDEGIPLGSGEVQREFSLGLRQLIEFPGKRGLRKTIGQTGERISEASLNRIKLLIMARVKKAYWKAAYSEMAVAQLESILETMSEYQKMAAIRFQAGEATSTDVLRGRLEEVRVRNELIEAKRTLQQDKSALWLEMGTETPAAFPSLVPMSFIPFAKGLEELKKEAIERPSIRALCEQLDLGEASIQLAKKAFYPDLRLGLFYPSLNASGWGFELEVSIPLWWQSLKGGVREAEALREQGLISFNSTLRRIMNRIESSFADVRASSDQLSLIETTLLKDASDLLSSGIVNFQYGRIDSLNLFDIYRMNKEVRLQYLRALLNYHLALAELEAAGENPDA